MGNAASMEKERILVVIVEPKKKPYKKWINNDDWVFQDIVGGFYKTLCLDTIKRREVNFTFNREVNLLKMPFRPNEIIVGTFFLSKADPRERIISFTEREADRAIKNMMPIQVYS